jgi:hypothetical protein
MKFLLGKTTATPGALEALVRNEQMPDTFLLRHVSGDWKEMSEHDQAANAAALIPDPEFNEYDRVFSAYTLRDTTKIWIITEADRSSTCILLPSEY